MVRTIIIYSEKIRQHMTNILAYFFKHKKITNANYFLTKKIQSFEHIPLSLSPKYPYLIDEDEQIVQINLSLSNDIIHFFSIINQQSLTLQLFA